MNPTDVAKAEAQAAEQRWENAIGIAKCAKEAYDSDPNRINRISLMAALRLVKETRAQVEEWLVK